MYELVNQTFFTSLSLFYQLKSQTNPAALKLWYSDQRCKSRLGLIFNKNFYISFVCRLRKGMLKALGSCFLSSWFYLASFKLLCMTLHNLAVSSIKNAGGITPPASLRVKATSFMWQSQQCCRYGLAAPHWVAGRRRKGKGEAQQGGHCVTVSLHIRFLGCSPKEKLSGSYISRDNQFGFLPHSRGRTSKSAHNWFSSSSKRSRHRKIPDGNVFKTQ